MLAAGLLFEHVVSSNPFNEMSYNILSIAYPLTAVGPDAVGGSEQILTLLDGALTSAGHRSLVIAAAGSVVSGTLIASPAADGPLDDERRRWGQQMHSQLIARVLERFPVDLIHMHSLDFHCYLPADNIPVLATLHLPTDWYPKSIFNLNRPNFYLNCVSLSQQQSCPACPYLLPYISNGIDVAQFDERCSKKGYVLAMGRICPEKGFHFALRAARMAGRELLLAGEISPQASHRNYFQTEIEPLLDRQRCFIGPVGLTRKRRLLSEAGCLLIPSTVAETSSLVAMEALAAGTPVIAFRSGALPEIVEHGSNGFVVEDMEQMAAAIGKISSIDPEACRSSARSHFLADEMIRSYFGAYARIIEAARYPGSEPLPEGSSPQARSANMF
jgi:glycosyltransferase involved in cell wall biosynthesis